MRGILEELSTLEETIASLNRVNDWLEANIRTCNIALKLYASLRNRFVSTYKRVVLKTATAEDHAIIGAGNMWAHGGDAKVDCMLYVGNRLRTHHETFRSLYWLYHETVAILGKKSLGWMHLSRGLILNCLDHCETFTVLNRHAAFAPLRFKYPSGHFHELFKTFIYMFEKRGLGLDVRYLTGVTTAVRRAYYDFVACLECEEV
ncbi:hypothetical protein HOY82DRAFT_476457 [Tuber indicum]|nr:hypothetical protein HOY82DRAFT_476457 [Tuber indicum]